MWRAPPSGGRHSHAPRCLRIAGRHSDRPGVRRLDCAASLLGAVSRRRKRAALAQVCVRHDALGRDRLSRLLIVGRIRLLLAPLAAGFAVTLALCAGLTAGCLRGWWERAAGTLTDLCLSLPWLFLLLAARSMLPLNADPAASILVTFSLLGLLGWAGRRHRYPVLFIAYIDTRGFGVHYLQPQRAILRLQLHSVVLLRPRLPS
jgi:hypothetical protein